MTTLVQTVLVISLAVMLGVEAGLLTAHQSPVGVGSTVVVAALFIANLVWSRER